jgi:hypothetical protein
MHYGTEKISTFLFHWRIYPKRITGRPVLKLPCFCGTLLCIGSVGDPYNTVFGGVADAKKLTAILSAKAGPESTGLSEAQPAPP